MLSTEIDVYCDDDGDGGIDSYIYGGDGTSLTLTFSTDGSSSNDGFLLEVTSLGKRAYRFQQLNTSNVSVLDFYKNIQYESEASFLHTESPAGNLSVCNDTVTTRYTTANIHDDATTVDDAPANINSDADDDGNAPVNINDDADDDGIAPVNINSGTDDDDNAPVNINSDTDDDGNAPVNINDDADDDDGHSAADSHHNSAAVLIAVVSIATMIEAVLGIDVKPY